MSRNRRAGCLALGLAFSAALCACAVGPDFHRPPAPAVGGYAMTGDTVPQSQRIALGAEVQGAWWEAFHSPALDGLMNTALAGNPTLRSADATLAEARADLAFARGHRLPQADLSLGVEQERLNFSALGFDASNFPGFSNNPTFSLYSIGATVSYALDVFGEQKRGVESAKARVEAQARQLDAAYLTLTGQIATQAAVIAAIHAELAEIDGMQQADQHDIALVRSAQAVGGVAVEARVNAEAQSAADAALRPPLEQQLAQARHALALLVGKTPADYTPPDFTLVDLPLPTTVPVSLPSALVRQRPDILQAEAEMHSAVAEIGVQTAKLYPNIDLSAGLTQSALSPEHVFDWQSSAYTLGAGLTQPLFHGGELRAQREAAVRVAEARASDYQATVLRAFTQVADLMTALAHDEDAANAQQRSLDSAQATLRFNQAAYREGGRGLLPVVDSQRQVNAAELRLTQAAAQRYLDTVQLFVATGRGWSPPAQGLPQHEAMAGAIR